MMITLKNWRTPEPIERRVFVSIMNFFLSLRKDNALSKTIRIEEGF